MMGFYSGRYLLICIVMQESSVTQESEGAMAEVKNCNSGPEISFTLRCSAETNE